MSFDPFTYYLLFISTSCSHPLTQCVFILITKTREWMLACNVSHHVYYDLLSRSQEWSKIFKIWSYIIQFFFWRRSIQHKSNSTEISFSALTCHCTFLKVSKLSFFRKIKAEEFECGWRREYIKSRPSINSIIPRFHL